MHQYLDFWSPALHLFARFNLLPNCKHTAETNQQQNKTFLHFITYLNLCLVSTIPLPFFHSVAVIAIAGENGNAGNVFPYTYRDEVTRTLIGCPPTAERQK